MRQEPVVSGNSKIIVDSHTKGNDMRLRTICENIRKTEFYDFYALTYVYQSLKTSTGVDQEYKKEVTDTLRDLAGYIFDDHMNQLCQTIAGRILDLGHLNDYYKTKDKSLLRKGNLAVCPKYGIHLVLQDMPNSKKLHDPKTMAYFKHWPYKNPNEIAMLPIPQKGKFINELVRFRDGHATSFTNVGGTWEKLATSFTQLAETNTNNLDAVILAIDQIYGLTHHNGQILDHFDERSWMEKALNTRTLTSPKNLLFHASPYIRELLTSANIGVPQHEPVSAISELAVMLARYDARVKLFGYSYRIVDKDTFELKLDMRICKQATRTLPVWVPITSWTEIQYDKWGADGPGFYATSHDYSKDKEAVVTIFGKVEGTNIILYDQNHKRIDNAQHHKPKYHFAPNHDQTLQTMGVIRLSKPISDIVEILVANIECFASVANIAWQPIKGNPNPPRSKRP